MNNDDALEWKNQGEGQQLTTADYTVKGWQDDEDAKVDRMNLRRGFKTTEIALSAKRITVRNCYDKYKCVYHQDKQT